MVDVWYEHQTLVPYAVRVGAGTALWSRRPKVVNNVIVRRPSGNVRQGGLARGYTLPTAMFVPAGDGPTLSEVLSRLNPEEQAFYQPASSACRQRPIPF